MSPLNQSIFHLSSYLRVKTRASYQKIMNTRYCCAFVIETTGLWRLGDLIRRTNLAAAKTSSDQVVASRRYHFIPTIPLQPGVSSSPSHLSHRRLHLEGRRRRGDWRNTITHQSCRFGRELSG